MRPGPGGVQQLHHVENDNDCTRTDVVAENFEAAGGSGTISTVSDAAISASLEANGISEQRPQLEIPPVRAVGNPPTSGFSNDPVNTATGNFVENEEDLRFEGKATHHELRIHPCNTPGLLPPADHRRVHRTEPLALRKHI